MAVAKSYENMEILGQPFEDEGKMYVKVKGKCPRCGGSGHYSYNQMDGTRCYGCGGSGIKTMNVRWYTDKERAAQDRAAERRAEKAAEAKEARRVKFAARNAFGFGELGFITLYKGDMQVISDFFKSFTIDEAGHRAAWYNTIFHWYTPSKMDVPENLPEGVEAVRLDWDDVRDETDEENLQMKDNEFVEAYVNSLISEPSKSEYQGNVGEWLVKTVTVTKNVALNSRYGESHMHILEDEDGNVYVWTTGSKNIEADRVITLKMKVKDHKDYKGIKQTIVWYCKEV